MVNFPLFSGIIIVVSGGGLHNYITRCRNEVSRKKDIFFIRKNTKKQNKTKKHKKKTKQQKHTASFEGMLKQKWRSDMNSIEKTRN